MAASRSKLVSRIPEIEVQASLAIQRAVHIAGEEIEFKTLQEMSKRRGTGNEMRRVRWKPDRGGFSGAMQAGAYYTGFSESGTLHQPARPVLEPVADEVWPRFLADVSAAYR